MNIWRMGQTLRLLLGGWCARAAAAPLSLRRRDRAAKVGVEPVESRALLATLGIGASIGDSRVDEAIASAQPYDVVEIAPGAYFEPALTEGGGGGVALRAPTIALDALTPGFNSNSRVDAGVAALSGNLETPFLREMAIDGLEIGDWGNSRGGAGLRAAAIDPQALGSRIYVGVNFPLDAALAIANPNPAPSADAPASPVALATSPAMTPEGESVSDVAVVSEGPSAADDSGLAWDDLSDVTLLADESGSALASTVVELSSVKPPPLSVTVQAQPYSASASSISNSNSKLDSTSKVNANAKAKTAARLKDAKAKPAKVGRIARKPIRAAVVATGSNKPKAARPRVQAPVQTQNPTPTSTPAQPRPLTATASATPQAQQVRPAPAAANLRSTVTEVFLETSPGPAGSPVTLSAYVRDVQAQGGIGSQGTVTFLADGQPIGSAPVVNGQARLTTTALTAGRRQIVARFDGTATLAGSLSTPATQMVFEAPPPPIMFGSRVYTPKLPTRTGESFVVFVRTPTTSASGVDEGNVRLFINGKAYATAEVDNGLATFVVSGLAAGDYAIGARRIATNGQALDLAPAVSHKVYNLAAGVKFPTLIWLFSDRTRNSAGLFTIKAIVADPGATGVVQLWDGDRLLGAMNLDQEATAVFQTGLAPGSHQLRAVYLGDANFNGANSILYSANF